MEAIKFSVDVNVNVNFSESAMAFIKAMFTVVPACSCGNNIAVKETHTAIIDDFSAIPKNKEQAEAFIDKVIKHQPAEEPEKPAEKPKSETEAGHNIEDVRAALAEKVNEHRETIKQKLNELGAPSVTKLAPAKYDEMYNFLKSL